MADCCGCNEQALAGLRARQGRVLRIVLWINAVMFVVEFTAGWLGRSTALLGDSLDMLGDALVYGFSLYVLHRGAAWRARAGLMKGLVMALLGLIVLAEAIGKAVAGLVPLPAVMGAVGFVALAANVVCFRLLTAHREDDVNMRSTWICSRNDLIANTGVLAAAGAVAWTGQLWPDVLVGLAIAGLFLRSAWGVIADARGELGAAAEAPTTR